MMSIPVTFIRGFPQARYQISQFPDSDKINEDPLP